MQVSIHPLVPQVGEGLSRVPLRRPRFTKTEAVILNELVNADGKPVTAAHLARLVDVKVSSVYAYICSIRAKLGEPAHNPQLILGDWNPENNYYYGWRFVG